MAQRIRDVMTSDPTVCPAAATLTDAAREMRDHEIGDVLVERDGALCGLVTDRDIVIRAIAAGADPNVTRLGDICSRELITLSPSDSIRDAVELMRQKSVRRLPVVDKGEAVGIVSLGDLAVVRDKDSVLSD